MGYSETMAENGRKGGLAKGKTFQPLAHEALRLFITKPNMTQKQIAQTLGVSQAFVSEHTKSLYVKMGRYERMIKNIVDDLTDDEIEKILLKAKLEEKMLSHIEDINTIKNHKCSKL
jgi:predicted transcriptional regulator